MDKKALIKALRDTVQSASNTVASGVSAPVDLIAAGLRKVGMPIPQAPVGGSQWMENMGLTIPVEDGIPKMAGDFLGMIVPMAATAKAPQIASAANKGLENLAMPRTLNTPGYGGQRGAVGFVYPQQEALDIAQRNAAKPVSEGGLGLPPNNTAMDRAKAMGFNEIGYTGTARDFISYDPTKAAGAGSGSREGPLGAWLTDDPRVASTFAEWSSRGQGGDVVYPMMIRGNKPYEVPAYSAIEDVLDANTKFSRPPYRMTQDKIDYEAAKKALAEKGDYVALRNTKTDSRDKPITQFLVTDPTAIRSRFAAFDPARINENNLLGYADPRLLGLLGLGTAGGIGAYNYMQSK